MVRVERILLLEESVVLLEESVVLLEESVVLLEERVALMQRPQRSQNPFLSQEGRTVREEVVRVVRGRRRKGDTNLRVRRWRETN